MRESPPAKPLLPKPYDDLVEVEAGSKGQVCIAMDVWNEINEIFATNPKEKGPMLRYFQRWCANHHLSDKQYRDEGTHSDGSKLGVQYKVRGFKSDQLRVYGVQVMLLGKRTFLGMNWDLKKKDKADTAKLEKTAERVGEVMRRNRK